MKILIVLLIFALLIVGFFIFQGRVSGSKPGPEPVAGDLPVCDSKPNCVCSVQEPSDSHYIAPINLAQHTAEDVVRAIESLGGTITDRHSNTDGAIIRATFTSGLFKFVDDLLVRIDGNQLQVRSSSRVGHSDFNANRKRVEQLRQVLSQ